MKPNSFLLIIFLHMSLAFYAQIPKDGQRWEDSHERASSLVQGSKCWTMRYLLVTYPERSTLYEETKPQGDSIIEGIAFKRKWKREWLENEQKPVSWRRTDEFVGEDEGKVYLCRTGSEPFLIMDFTLDVGELFQLSYRAWDPFSYVVESVSDTLLPGAGSNLKYLHLRGFERPNATNKWVEGIGSLNYGIEEDLTSAEGGIPILLSCTDGDRIIYQLEEEPSSVLQAIQYGAKADSCFDVQGRRLNGVPQRGMYIRDGRKYVVK